MFMLKIINIDKNICGVFHMEQSLDCIIHIFEALTGLKN